MSFLDGLFAGIAFLRSNGVQLAFQKAINFSTAFALSNNTATGAIDVSIDAPSLEVPISETNGLVTVGSDPANGLALGFAVPNNDGSANALFVDNQNNIVETTLGFQCPGLGVAGGHIRIGEVAAGSVSTPSTGFALYVDNADHKLKAKGSSGTVTIIANP